jgi:hypothetical protein
VNHDTVLTQQLKLQFDVDHWFPRSVFELAGDHEKWLAAATTAEK